MLNDSPTAILFLKICLVNLPRSGTFSGFDAVLNAALLDLEEICFYLDIFRIKIQWKFPLSFQAHCYTTAHDALRQHRWIDKKNGEKGLCGFISPVVFPVALFCSTNIYTHLKN